MKNTTLQILEKAARNVVQEQTRLDPALRELDAQQEQLHQEFICQHRENSRLRRQVLHLLDAQGAVACAEKDLMFYLGLQMGMELQTLDVMDSETV